MWRSVGIGCVGLGCAGLAAGQTAKISDRKLEISSSHGVVTAYAVAPNIVKITFRPSRSKEEPATAIMDQRGLRQARPIGTVEPDDHIATKEIQFGFNRRLLIGTKDRGWDLAVDVEKLADGVFDLDHPEDDRLYGMRGLGLFGRPAVDPKNGLLRNVGAKVAAGSQGDGGAPFAYSPHWGVLIDSIDGQFQSNGSHLVFRNGSRRQIEAYVVIGPPKQSIAALADLTGHAPMMPKWSLGFLNTQWGTDQKEVTDIVAEYRRRHIPIDSFIFDFDFKAWGEDDFGEWRWNSTRGAGNVGPDKYPDGASGKFGQQMAAQGIKLGGIMKPRILIQNSAGKTMKAAAEATAHHWWLPGKQPYNEYFSHRQANDLNFAKADCRAWYWDHSKPLFQTGIVGWWNDEADDGFDSLGHFHMQQALYEGQRRTANLRVWSVNRNFYIGAQRFGFGTWSGDISSGFRSMGEQRARMLSIIDLGQPHWTMDGGGFGGHPNSENYARWMQFASVVPMMRVHGTFGEKRQPWVYGTHAEEVTKKAIDFRYAMLPSWYSWEHDAYETGAGIVRPMFWEYPDDPQAANLTDQWMLGESLLASPVVDEGEKSHSIYLPAGKWYDYATDALFEGGQRISVAIDNKTWTDVPLFVRGGSIVATQPVQQYVGERKVDQITLDVWPDAAHEGSFTVYDDDGLSYNYERGDSFAQDVKVTETANSIRLELARPIGRFHGDLKTYRVRVHTAGRRTTLRRNAFVTDVRPSESGMMSFTIPAGFSNHVNLDFAP